MTSYFDEAPQAFSAMAIVAAWAIVMNAWLVDESAATAAIAGWAVLLVLFVAMTRSRNRWLHAGAAGFAWLLLMSEFAFELDRGVPSL